MTKNGQCMLPALALHRLAMMLEKDADRALQETLDMTFSQCMILRSLQKNPACSQRCLAKCRDLTQAAVSRHVESLREKKWVQRKENAKNRREHILRLTPAGEKRLDAGLEIIQKRVDDAFGILSSTDRDKLQETLERLLEHLCRAKEECCE